MSKTRSEAERLLNTIVSSRVRLNALQGDSSASVEPSTEEDEGAQADIEQVSTSQATHSAQEEELFSHLPIEDELTEFDEPPLVLGIDPEPVAETQHTLEAKPEDPDVDATMESSALDPEQVQSADVPDIATTAPLDDDYSLRETIENEAQDDRTTEPKTEPSDPFSFIDLIPPDPETDRVETSSEEPKHTAPPIRTKPLMPLPAPEAAGAPPATAPQSLQTQNDTKQVLSTDGLASPKEIAPRILDPDRATLEVDVYVEQDDEPYPVETDDDLPLLTDTSPPISTPTATPKAPAQTESVFDIVTNGLNALNRGDLHTALDRLSDALDWEPNNVEALLYRGRCRRDQGDVAGAMSDFLKAENLAPHSCEPYVEIGDLFFAKKDYSRAIVHYTEALSIHPGHAMALCRRGISYHHRRQSAQALDDLQGAKSLDEEIPNIDRYISMVSGRHRTPTRR